MKLPDLDLSPDINNLLKEAIENIASLINNGKYELRVETSPPTYTLDGAEPIIVYEGGLAYLYVYVKESGKWWKIEMTAVT